MTRMLNVRERSEYINSPANEIREGAAEVRKNLRNGPSLARKQAVNNDMRAKGLTNYAAWPCAIRSTSGTR